MKTAESRSKICQPHPVVRQLEVINALDRGAGGYRPWWVCADLFPGADGEAPVPAGKNWQAPWCMPSDNVLGRVSGQWLQVALPL